MPNDSETSGRPLASTPTPPQPPTPGITIQHLTSARVNDRETTQTSDDSLAKAKAHPSHRRLAGSKQASSSPHIGVSRPEQRSTNSPSKMSSPLQPVHYTRTGRVSKAKKGLKVHNCAKCGRSYTRAEHLRRHQKNHAQEDAVVCNVNNCGRSFVRMDLLQRHMERHNEPDKMSESPSAYTPEGSPEMSQTSISMPLPVAPVNITDTVPNTPFYQSTQPESSPAPDAASIPRYIQNPFRTPQLPRTPQVSSSGFSHVVRSSPTSTSFPNQMKQRGSYNGRSMTHMPVSIDAAATSYLGGWADAYNYSPGYSGYSSSTSGYTSPLPGPQEYPNVFSQAPLSHGYHRTRTSSDASFIEPWSHPSRSPTSTASTMAYWSSHEKTPTASGLAYIGASFPMTSMSMSTCVDPMTSYESLGPRSMAQRDDEEGVILFGEQAYGMGSITHTYPFEQYLDYFWRLFHPAFPIIHRPTFEHMNVPPILHAAMIATGGQYSNDISVKRKSRILHDRCIKLLERRDIAEPDRLCDYQAMFLIEFLSQYRARRAAKVLSSRLGRTYNKAAEESKLNMALLHDITTSSAYASDGETGHWQQWVELASWQRLLVSCYILESQQALLLARVPIPSLINFSGPDLPFPHHISAWDAPDTTAWAVACQHHPKEQQYVYSIAASTDRTSFDGFQSALLINAHYNRSETVAPYESVLPDFDLAHVLDAAPTTRRQFLTARLVQVVPIRALLAVSGESWILSEKVPTMQAFAPLKTTLRMWLTQLWYNTSPQTPPAPVKLAIQMSVSILEDALREQKDGVPLDVGPDMGIYFAGLVLWAITTAAHGKVNCLQPTARYVPLDPTLGGVPRKHPSHQQRLAPPPPGPIPLQQTSLDAREKSLMLSHAQITINAISFLSAVCVTHTDTSATEQMPSKISDLKQGCVCLLLWIKLRLHGTPLGAEATGKMPPSGKPTDGLGELLEGVAGSIERILVKGWDGWGI